MCPLISRALVASVLASAVALFSTAASASEFTFALPTAKTSAVSTPFDVAPRETAPLKRVIEIPPFDFPEPEPIASCRGCQLVNPFEPPPFTL
jgi:hypothetical protein